MVFFPFVDMFIVSGKTFDQVLGNTVWLTLPFHLSNYQVAWAFIAPYILNSMIVSGSSCAGVLLVSTLSAYAFARFRFPGREFLFFAIISLLMVPGILTLVPAFVLIKNLHLLNTRWALILPYVSSGQVFGIFLLRSYFSGLPEELFEAARLDGASDRAILLLVVVPLSLPILATLAILNLLATWNDIIWPSVVIDDPGMKTLAIGLLQFNSGFQTDLGSQMAGYAIAALPLIIVFAFSVVSSSPVSPPAL